MLNSVFPYGSVSPFFFNQGHKMILKKWEQKMPLRISFFLDGKAADLV